MNRIYITIVVAAVSVAAHAQSIDSVLYAIERNSLELRAARSGNQAAAFGMKAENAPDAPSVEYSPFFRKGAAGIASSELVVSQEFDFPTLYSARSKAGRLQRDALAMEYMDLRRSVLLSAKMKCLELVMLDRTAGILRERMANAGSLLTLFEKKYAAGDATAIELNRIRMELMDMQAEQQQNETARQAAVLGLTAMNGGLPLALDSVSYPAVGGDVSDEKMLVVAQDDDTGIRAAAASLAASEQDVKVCRQGWLPKLSVGYRRNTELDEASNGFLVGASFPVFATGSRVRAAKARSAAARLSLDNTRMQVRNETEAQLRELAGLRTTMRVYDLGIMRRTLELLGKSVAAGNMSLTDYYAEADRIYRQWQTFLSVENRYHTLRATLYKNDL